MSELLSMSPSQLGALLVLVALFMQDTLQAQQQLVRSKPARAATAFAWQRSMRYWIEET